MARKHRNRRGDRPLARAENPQLAAAIAAAQGGIDPFSGRRAVDIKIVAPSSIWSGRLENRDPVLRQFGSWEGLTFYARIFRQFPTVYGVARLWADKVCAIDRRIKAGDENDGASRELADKLRKLYRRIQDVHILNSKMAMGRFFGFAATGKSDWRLDEETGFLAPHDLYDIPPQYLKFGPSGEPFALTDFDPIGKPIDPAALFFYRWGSRFTPYGESDLQYCYMALWYLQNVRQFGLQALEILGRPIPWVEVPETIVGDDYDRLEAGLKAQYKYYVITRTTANRTNVTFPSLNVVANGNAGRSELEYVRFLYGEVYICILGVQMTQDSSGGSRALEDTRLDVIEDKTPPGSQALDQSWTRGWADHICEINVPSIRRELRPYFDSDASKPQIDPGALAQVVDIGSKLAVGQIAPAFAERALIAAGLPPEWARDMVRPNFDERRQLAA